MASGNQNERQAKAKVAIVTGAGRGIGSAIASRLGADGITVVAAHRSQATGEKIVEHIQLLGGNAVFFKTDVTEAADVARLVAVTRERFGRIDILCNNAGVDLVATIVDSTEEDFERVIGVNVRGAFLLCKHAIPVMREVGGGSIINIASVAALVGLPSSALYAASKGAILSLTRQLARDYAGDGIRVNAVAPGSTDTPQLHDYLSRQTDPSGARAAVEGLNPQHRVGTPSEIAAAVAFLASEESSFVTGATLVVDGGLVIQ